VVTPAHPPGAIRCGEQGVDLIPVEERDEFAVSALLRDGKYALDQRRVFRVA